MLVIVLIAAYNIYNNNQINVVVQEVEIDGLPDEFDGFTILQIADLHNKYFGENQEKLIKLINEQEFDIMAICGDMQDNDNEGYEGFIKLLEGIENKENIFYTPGNHGPYPYTNDRGYTNFLLDTEKLKREYIYGEEKELSEAGEVIKSFGVKFLDNAYEIRRGSKSLWISEFLYKDQLEIITDGKYSDNQYNDGDDTVNIAVTHYPMENELLNEEFIKNIPSYDIVLAAHYHGGQIRIPFIGAFYIPNLDKGVFFPEEDEVSGLNKYGNIYQYVTRGLGAGGPYRFLRYRIFNRPEINIIKLIKK